MHQVSSRRWVNDMNAKALALGFLLVLVVVGGIAVAQSGYQIVGDSATGGGVSSGSGYTVKGAAGQAAAQVLTGSGYVLTGGLVPSSSSQDSSDVFIPFVQRE